MLSNKNISIICLLIITGFYQSNSQNNEPNSQIQIPISQVSNHGYKPDGSMDLTFAKTTQQRNQFIQTSGQVLPGTNFIDHMFETDGDDDFHFFLPVDQQVALHITAYVALQNTFVRIQNVQEQPPVRLMVYQGNSNIIVKTSFYFQKYIVFNGLNNTQYTLKFQTSGNKKLINLALKLFVETSDINQTLTKNHADYYKRITSALKTQITQIVNQFSVYWFLDQGIMRLSLQKIRQYYYFQLFQMFIFAIFSIIQVKMLFKLLKGNSII